MKIVERRRSLNSKMILGDNNSVMKAKATLLSVGIACFTILWASSVHAGSELSVTNDQNKTDYSIKSTDSGANEIGKGTGDIYNPGVSPTNQGKSRGHHKGRRSGKGNTAQKPYGGQEQGQPPAQGSPPGKPTGQPPAPANPRGKPMGDEQGQPPASGRQLNI